MGTENDLAVQNGKDIVFGRVKELPGIELYRGKEVTCSIPRHMHWFFSLGVCLGGARIHRTANRDYHVTGGNLVVINCGEVHSGIIPDGCNYSNLLIRLDRHSLMELLDDIAGRRRDNIRLSAPVIRDRELAQATRRLYDVLACPGSNLEKEYMLTAVLGELYVTHAQEDLNPRSLGNEKSAVRRVCEYLEEYCSEDLSLRELARIAGLNSYYLSRVFAQQIGIPPHTYLMNARLKKATDLLAEGKSIITVAMETGFCDQSHFHKAFKSRFGISPGQYEC